MTGKSKYILVAMLTLCACSHTPVSPPSGKSSVPITTATASIDFGVIPLWREADTTFTLRLSGTDSITSVLISDSDWFLSNTQITIRKKDSTVMLNLAYQPESISNHVGSMYLLSGQDTVAFVSLKGGTSQFERHIGDSYVYQTSFGFDSISVTGLPLTVVASDSGFLAQELERAWVDNNGDLLLDGMGGGLGSVRLPIVSGIPYYSSSNGTPDTVLGGFLTWYATADTVADTTIWVGDFELHSKIVTAYESDSWQAWGGSEYSSGSETLRDTYCSDIGFFTSMHGYRVGGGTFDEEYNLIRFHLKR
jgi:hypothetical protein